MLFICFSSSLRPALTRQFFESVASYSLSWSRSSSDSQRIVITVLSVTLCTHGALVKIRCQASRPDLLGVLGEVGIPSTYGSATSPATPWRSAL